MNIRIQQAVALLALVSGAQAALAFSQRVENVTELISAFASAMNSSDSTKEIVLAPGTYDLSGLDESTNPGYPDSKKYGTMSAPDTNGKCCIWWGGKLVIRGENARPWQEKSEEEKSVLIGADDARIFYGYGGGGRSSVISNLTFKAGHAPSEQHAGAVLWGGPQDRGYVANCEFVDCSGSVGGALRNVSAVNCGFERCTATKGGAAHANTYSGVCNHFSNCIFRTCSAATEGGAIYFENGAIVSRCQFLTNSVTDASGLGGALYVQNCLTDYTSVEGNGFVANQSAGTAGAAFVLKVDSAYGPAAEFRGCAFEDNSAAKFGGALSNVVARSCSFVGNKAKSGGAAVACRIYDCGFTNNVATDTAGALYACEAYRSSFVTNFAKAAGAMYRGTADTCVFLTNCTDAVNYGGGGAVNSAQVTNCWFEGNVCGSGRGGAVTLSRVFDSTFTNNFATTGGSANESYCERCHFRGDGVTTYGGYRDCDFIGVVNSRAASRNDSVLKNTSGTFGATNCLIAGCTTTYLLENKGTASLINCTFADNVVNGWGGGVYNNAAGAAVEVVNCLFADNGLTGGGGSVDLAVWAGSGTASVSHCLYKNTPVEAKTSPGVLEGQIHANPKFVGKSKYAAEYPDCPYMPYGMSPARGTGQVMAWMANATDITGKKARLSAPDVVDIGCYSIWLSGPGLILLFK